jgi:hypothetical protein
MSPQLQLLSLRKPTICHSSSSRVIMRSLPDICRETRVFSLSEQANRCFRGFLGAKKCLINQKTWLLISICKTVPGDE